MSVWIENLKIDLETRPVIILHGNVRDKYIDKTGRVYENLTEIIQIVAKGLPISFNELTFYDPVNNERIIAQQPAHQKQTTRPKHRSELGDSEPVKPTGQKLPPERVLANWVRQLCTTSENRLMTIFYLDKLIPYKTSYQDEEKEILLWLEKAIENITPNNRLIMVALQDTMIPVELYTHAPKTSVLPLTMPNKDDRIRYLNVRLDSGQETEERHKLIANLTDGLFLRDLDNIIKSIQSASNLNEREVRRLVNKYRIGEQEDYWRSLDITRIDRAMRWFEQEQGVKGQQEAIGKVRDMLCMARSGLSGFASDTSSKPKGVLFFAGPTGVGKTFLAKKLARFLFDTEEAFLRFDMSEFKEEHTVSKLIGSPPGYVGFEQGGRLTNSVREKPFSVVLFDEIEKAHPKIMDIFLQLLDEGRLTDSRGQTVFFTETVIIFTSNLGTRSTDSRGHRIDYEKQPLDRILADHQLTEESKKVQIREHFINSVEQFFTLEISRPELLNRIGNNIIPFNYIQDATIQKKIVQSHLDRIKADFEDKYRSNRYKVTFEEEEIVTHLVEKFGERIKRFGARGITNAINDLIIMKLAFSVLSAEHDNRTNVHFKVTFNRHKQDVGVHF